MSRPLRFLARAVLRLHARWKWLLSFRKSQWTVADYPVRLHRNPVPDPDQAWVARIVHWPGPVGVGRDPHGALACLRDSFRAIAAARLARGERLPRPGVPEPARFAPAVRIARHAELLGEFSEKVMGLRPGELLFLSDASTLHDFGDDGEVERMRGLVRSLYGVETADLPEPTIAAILERIAQARAAPPTAG